MVNSTQINKETFLGMYGYKQYTDWAKQDHPMDIMVEDSKAKGQKSNKGNREGNQNKTEIKISAPAARTGDTQKQEDRRQQAKQG